MSAVVEAGIRIPVQDAETCVLCAEHHTERAAASSDRRDDVLPWTLVLTATVVVASLGIGIERWFGLGAALGVLAGGACSWLTLRVGLRRLARAHVRELAALAAAGDDRVATVIRQFEWAVNDVVKLKRDYERSEAGADLLMSQARTREHYTRKVERQLFEARERLAALAALSTICTSEEPDPLADALAGIIPFAWSLHTDRYQVSLELECGVTSHRPTRVRVVDAADGRAVLVSGTPKWSDEGRAAFSLANPPTDLIIDLDAGRELRYTFEALSEYEWHPVRLEDSGTRTKVITDKQGRLYRVSDEPDAAQLLAPTLPLN